MGRTSAPKPSAATRRRPPGSRGSGAWSARATIHLARARPPVRSPDAAARRRPARSPQREPRADRAREIGGEVDVRAGRAPVGEAAVERGQRDAARIREIARTALEQQRVAGHEDSFRGLGGRILPAAELQLVGFELVPAGPARRGGGGQAPPPARARPREAPAHPRGGPGGGPPVPPP